MPESSYFDLEKDEQIFELFQERIFYLFTLIGSVLFVPFIINHLVNGNYDLAFIISVINVCFLVNLYSIKKIDKPLISPEVIGFFSFIAITGTVFFKGAVGVYWAFPVMIMNYLILNYRVANFLVGFQTIAVGLVLWHLDEFSGIFRAISTLLITQILMISVIRMIVDFNDRLQKLIFKDPLTGAYNRRFLRKHVHHHLQEVDVSSLVHIMIDVDHFKRINDKYGHDKGDQILKQIVESVLDVIKGKSNLLLFRMGGEEFLLLGHNQSLGEAQGLAEEIKNSSHKILIDNAAVTVSIGLHVFKGGMKEYNFKECFRIADDALYLAKENGRDRVETK